MLEVTGSAGQVIAGRYRLVELVGEGGMGCVWRADDLKLGSPAAVKLVRPAVAERPGIRERFLREAKAAALLRGVNVVQVLDHGVEGGAPFIAMEYLEGESLAARLERERRLSPAATAYVMAGVARALRRAHKLGVVHRDLKPDNIFLARDEAGDIVKVVDFGIAKVLGPIALDSQERRRTETGVMLGTPCYMSPEQARGRKEMDTRSDLWSFAVIAFECLTGERPFDAAALGELMMQICSEPIPRPSSVAEVPPGFDAWFERATQRDPDARFQTARELSDALSEVLTPGERWTDASTDSEPEARPARPITPFESQPTVPDEHPSGEAAGASDDGTGEDGIGEDRAGKSSTPEGWIAGGATAKDSTAKDSTAKDSTAKDSTAKDSTVEQPPRPPARRGLLVGAIAAVAAATVFAVASSGRRGGDTASGLEAGAPARGVVAAQPAPAETGAGDGKARVAGGALPDTTAPAAGDTAAPAPAASTPSTASATGAASASPATRALNTQSILSAPHPATPPGSPGTASTAPVPVPSPAPAPVRPSGAGAGAPPARATAAPSAATAPTAQPELPREKFE